MEVICVEGDNYTVIWFAKGRYQELYVEEEYLTKVKTLPKKL